MPTANKHPMQDHVILTSHPGAAYSQAVKLQWGAKTAMERGPIVATLHKPLERNCIGAHSGPYMVYHALALAAGQLSPAHKADLSNTDPVFDFGPFDSWYDADRIVTLDPWGAKINAHFSNYLKAGKDIRPTIAITRAHLQLIEIQKALEEGTLKKDGQVITEQGDVSVTKAAIEPVWYLPGMSKRLGISEVEMRKILFQQTGGMYPELVTRFDLKVLLPPIGGTSVYIFGNPAYLSDPTKTLTARVHDECNGSDVFGSDICTCRPYLIHGIEECIRTAQQGGVGIIVYFRKEGRALGEVTKYLVYNARKRQEGGDTAANYFKRTECIAGVEDMRFQEFMPDVLNFFGITKIDNLISMSDMKYNALTKNGIKIMNRHTIPDEMIPKDAQVEMEAKKAAGYFNHGDALDKENLQKVKGRGLEE